jgi:hypothetical protein
MTDPERIAKLEAQVSLLITAFQKLAEHQAKHAEWLAAVKAVTENHSAALKSLIETPAPPAPPAPKPAVN